MQPIMLNSTRVWTMKLIAWLCWTQSSIIEFTTSMSVNETNEYLLFLVLDLLTLEQIITTILQTYNYIVRIIMWKNLASKQWHSQYKYRLHNTWNHVHKQNLHSNINIALRHNSNKSNGTLMFCMLYLLKSLLNFSRRYQWQHDTSVTKARRRSKDPHTKHKMWCMFVLYILIKCQTYPTLLFFCTLFTLFR